MKRPRQDSQVDYSGTTRGGENDAAYANALKQNDTQNARIELQNATWRAAVARMRYETGSFKEFSDNEAFQRQVLDVIFQLTYHAG